MKKELENQLFNRFKFYRQGTSPKDYFFWGFECDSGWFNLLWDLSLKLEAIGFEGPVTQVKEKYAILHYYASTTEEQDKLIDTAEDLSAVTCEICGRKGKIRDYGWLKVLCFWHYLPIYIKRKMKWK